MGSVNKTRHAILGMLIEGPKTGYEIRSFMERSTVYFWRESDSTIYPMLKVLAKEGKVTSRVDHVGKKKKEVFSITEEGVDEFNVWMKNPTGSEIQRNEFLLKLFFVTGPQEMIRLFHERIEKAKQTYEEYKKIEEKLEGITESPYKTARVKALMYGMAHLECEMRWLKKQINE